jgi:hypothetical protein
VKLDPIVEDLRRYEEEQWAAKCERKQSNDELQWLETKDYPTMDDFAYETIAPDVGINLNAIPKKKSKKGKKHKGVSIGVDD